MQPVRAWLPPAIDACAAHGEHTCCAQADIPEPLDDDLKRLRDFAVVSGGTIVINEAQ